jgi:phosphatidylethanolamine-binding protein (PEBP) family uncharacterized protein
MEKLKHYFKSIFTMGIIMFFIGAGLIIILSCNKSNEQSEPLNTTFTLKSPAVASDSLLPKAYTCDGESSMPPLEWSGSPGAAKCFAIIMHHVASPTDIHWYIVLYNIPVSIKKIDNNSINIGTWGCNSVNRHTEYAPPCSQGPGRKDYIITLYALSELIDPKVPANEVNRETLLQAMAGKIISSTSITVWYSRDLK